MRCTSSYTVLSAPTVTRADFRCSGRNIITHAGVLVLSMQYYYGDGDEVVGFVEESEWAWKRNGSYICTLSMNT